MYNPNHTWKEQRSRKSKRFSQGKQPDTFTQSNKVLRNIFFRSATVCSSPSKLRRFLSLKTMLITSYHACMNFPFQHEWRKNLNITPPPPPLPLPTKKRDMNDDTLPVELCNSKLYAATGKLYLREWNKRPKYKSPQISKERFKTIQGLRIHSKK